MATKVCSHCKQEKDVSEFSRRTSSKDGLSYNCKQCERLISKLSYKRRKEQKRRRRYYEEHREEVLAASARNYEQNREMRLQQSKDYREAHPEVWRRSGAKRRSRIKESGREPYTRADVIEKCSAAGILLCGICGLPILQDEDWDVDHIIPIAEGGADTLDNVRAAHKRCNLKRPKDGRDVQ